MADITLAAHARTEFGSRPSGRLRRAGQVPAVVYGLGADTVSISVTERDLTHILAGESGANTLITLSVDGADVLTLARQIRRHPVRGNLEHVDFVRVRRDVAVSADIPVHLVGEAEGVKDGGLLEQLMFSLTVEARPGDIPVAIEVDVAALGIGDHLNVSDLPLPARVVTHADPDEVVAHVTAPRVSTPGSEGEADGGEAGEAAGESGA
jgi:large subunit ribosomal protein L25